MKVSFREDLVPIAIASLHQESNTFSPVWTRYADFDPVFGSAVLDRHRGKLTETGGIIEVLEGAGKKIVPIGAAWAITANRVHREDFDQLANDFCSRLEAAGKVNAVIFDMHGSMTAEGVDDVEGYMLARFRKIVGPDVPIVVTLDLHANITQAMMLHATALIGYHTYPHVDMYEVGVKAARLLLRILSGKVRPVMAWRKLPLIVNAENSQSSSGPFGALIRKAKRLEAEGKAEAVSVFPVQPWMDIEEMGSAVVVVGNGDVQAASRRAAKLAQRFWDTRQRFEVKLTPAKEAIEEALAVEGGPVVLAESSDSTGSGSPGDSTGVLKYLVKAPLTAPAAIFVVDPEAAARLCALGVGESTTLSIGGALDRKHSKPIKVTGRVRMISDGRWTARARGYNTGIETCMGRSVVLDVGQVRVLIAEKSAMTVDPELFRSHGIDPAWCKIVVVKSPNGFRAAYEPIARKVILVDTPGVSSANLGSFHWRTLTRPIYPLDRDTKYKA